jgi:hypothetical protein
MKTATGARCLCSQTTLRAVARRWTRAPPKIAGATPSGRVFFLDAFFHQTHL